MRSRAPRPTLVVSVVILAALALAPQAQAGDQVTDLLGSPTGANGTAGGLFSNSSRAYLAINQSGAGGVAAGTLYAAEQNRIQQFDPTGTFVRAWGQDVIVATGPPPNANGTAFEICDTTTIPANIPSECKNGSTSGTTANGGQLNGPKGIAVDQATGDIYVLESGGRRISVFDSTGHFLRAFGPDVNLPAGGTAPEICTVAAQCKQGAAAGTGPGQFSSISTSLTLTPSGSVLAMDGNNRRIHRFSFAGEYVETYGWNVNPSGGSGKLETCTAVTGCQAAPEGSIDSEAGVLEQISLLVTDSAGFTYAHNPKSRRVVKFNPTFTSVSEFAPSLLSGGFSSIGTQPIADHPITTNIAVDPATENLYAVQAEAKGGVPVARILELSSGGSLVDTHGADSGLPAITGEYAGFAIRSSDQRQYLTVGAPAGARILILDSTNPTSPGVEAHAPSALTSTGATLHGHVDPAGIVTSYRFEISSNGFKTKRSIPAADSDAGPLSSNNPISQQVSGLEPNTNYKVKVVAQRIFKIGGVQTSAPVSFSTPPAAPDASEAAAFQLTATSVRLVGRIDPNSSPTTYRFDYGETEALGSSVPVPDGSVGAGAGQKQISQVLSGLKSGGTYYFKLVATNATDTVETQLMSFQLGAIPADSSRHYEMVSPVDKNSTHVFPTSNLGVGDLNRITTAEIDSGDVVSPDGSAVGFFSHASFANIEYGQSELNEAGYIARRNASGWATEAAVPHTATDGNAPWGVSERLYSADLTKFVLGVGTGNDNFIPLKGSELVPGTGSSPSNVLLRNPNGSISFLYKGNDLNPPAGSAPRPNVAWATPDLETMAIGTATVLSAEPDIPSATIGKVYTLQNGQFELASVSPGGTPFATESKVGAANRDSPVTTNALSEDGEYVFFSNPAQGGDIFDLIPAAAKIYRRGKGETVLVSPSKRTPVDPLGEKAKLYITSTPDQGSDASAAVFFTSQEQLTDDSNTGPTRTGNELYRYEINSDELTAISAESNDANGAQVLGLLDVSDDGKSAYYVARGQVIAGKGTAGQPNLYMWRDDGSADGETRFIATLAGTNCEPVDASQPRFASIGDGCNWAQGIGLTGGAIGNGLSPGPYRRSSRVTPTGDHLLFESSVRLTGYDNAGLSQIYLYDAAADSAKGTLSCVSCNPSGEPPARPALVPDSLSGLPGGDLTRVMSDDGRRVFFPSREALVPKDTNGVQDIYQWQDGEVTLISSGLSPRNSFWLGASRSGDDVFFSTTERLVPGSDPDALSDIYDARIGSKLPISEPVAPCTGEDCKAVATSQPDASAPSSSSLSGVGNVVTPSARCSRSQVRRGSRCVAKRKLAQQRCVKRKGTAKRRCVTQQVRRLNRTANADRRAGR